MAKEQFESDKKSLKSVRNNFFLTKKRKTKRRGVREASSNDLMILLHQQKFLFPTKS